MVFIAASRNGLEPLFGEGLIAFDRAPVDSVC